MFPKEIEEIQSKLTKLIERAERDACSYEKLVILMPEPIFWILRFNSGGMVGRNTPTADDIEALQRLMRPEIASAINAPNGMTFMGLPIIPSSSFKKIIILNVESIDAYFEKDN